MSTLLIPKEILPKETRVAANPDTVKAFVKKGLRVIVQSGAGEKSFLSDEAYQQAGAEIGTQDTKALYQEADVVLKLHPPIYKLPSGEYEVSLLKEGTLLISHLWPSEHAELVKQLQERNITTFAMDQIPRTTKAQSMDALSSQSNIAGYKAVLMAADALPKMFPLLMTAAGTIRPAKVVIMGAGVAGLQAIATARRLGAVVEVSDIRPAVKEEVESLGAKFISIETDDSLQDAGGYAKEVSADFLKQQQALVKQHILAADVVITTALVPGKRAPLLVTAEMVEAMKPGSVIVDLATSQGGNCALSEEDKTVVKHEITIIGRTNLPALLPRNASDAYARNILSVLKHLIPKDATAPVFDFDDEITDGSIVTHAKEIRQARTRQMLGLPPLKQDAKADEDTAQSKPDDTETAKADDNQKAPPSTPAKAPAKAETPAPEKAETPAPKDAGDTPQGTDKKS